MEVASGVFLGDRALQQDSVETFQHRATGFWLLALSDGIGGAGNGHLASRLIVRSAMTYLKAHIGDVSTGAAMPEVLRRAAFAANRSLASASAKHPEKAGMGGTLLLAVLARNRLYYLSIGDSIIFRLRKGELSRINTLHSLSDKVEALEARGQIAAGMARAAVMRSTLTSALTGEKPSKIDVPDNGLAIARGDALMLASDGIETLTDATLAEAMAAASQDGAARGVADIIDRIERQASRGQDNVSITLATFETR